MKHKFSPPAFVPYSYSSSSFIALLETLILLFLLHNLLSLHPSLL